MKFVWLFLALIFAPEFALAKWSAGFEFQTWAVHDRIENDIYDEPYAHDDSVSMLEGRFRYRRGKFNFAFDPQLRFLGTQSENNTTRPIDPYRPTIQAPARGLKLESSLVTNPNSQFQASAERLTVGYKSGAAEVIAGRQPFSLGVMKIVPIWNRFVVNLPLPGLFLQFPNRDGVAVRYQRGFWSMQAFGIAEDQASNNAYLWENIFEIQSVELHLLSGMWANNLAAGVAGTVPFLGGSLRGEFLGVGLRSTDPIQMYQFGFGFETAFSASWKMTIEQLYLSTGAINQIDYDTSTLNAFRPLLAQDYVVLKLKYDSGAYYTVEPEVILNIIDGSTMAGGEFIYSLGDHSEVGFQLTWPTGGSGQEFSAYATPLGSYGPIGTPEQLYARYRVTY